MEKESTVESQYAMFVAYQTMKERCQQLQARLTSVEEENSQLRQQFIKNDLQVSQKYIKDDENHSNQQDKIEELNKQKSQLIKYISMVSQENRQLWKRLTWLTQVDKSRDNLSDALKYFPNKIPMALNFSFKDNSKLLCTSQNEDCSLEEISLRLIDTIIDGKSELKHQYLNIAEHLPEDEYNLKNVGFSYPEDNNVNSVEKLKYHNIKLNQLKETILSQQNKLKSVLQNLKKKKNETSINDINNIQKLIGPSKTQHDNSLLKTGGQQSNLFSSNSTLEKKIDNQSDDHVCPLCGIVYKKSVPFDLFQEHVIDHFTKESLNDIEM